MKLFDTNKQSYVHPIFDQQINIYVCGITPYDSAHLGHVLTFMTYDLLSRRLEDKGHAVRMVRNITDVDEPIYRKAAELEIDYRELAEREITSFNKALEQLHFLSVFAAPRASEYIAEMAEAVENLLLSKHAYRLDNNDIYFDTASQSDFGLAANISEKVRLGLLSARGGDPERVDKRNKTDFLLWKSITDPTDSAQWDTAVGTGRPGWHIECSVMSQAILGSQFDIHGGGSDLIFPHHASEIAQSIALHNTNPAKLWMHVSPMLLSGEKMSKSLGNLVFAKDLLKEHDGDVIKLALMHYHHRIGGEWQDELLHSAQQLIYDLSAAKNDASIQDANWLLNEVIKALDDDINTLEVIDALKAFASGHMHHENSQEALTKQAALERVMRLIGIQF